MAVFGRFGAARFVRYGDCQNGGVRTEGRDPNWRSGLRAVGNCSGQCYSKPRAAGFQARGVSSLVASRCRPAFGSPLAIGRRCAKKSRSVVSTFKFGTHRSSK
jgi:hypothetical protein